MATTTVALPSPVRLRRGILIAVALTALNLRTAVTGFSVLTGQASEDLHFGPVVTGAIGTIITACFAVAAFAAPPLARRLGLELTAAIAVATATAGIVLRALSWSPEIMIAATAIAFAGVGTANVILIPIVKEHFPEKLRSVSTMYMVLLQVGQLAAPLLAVPLASAFGWRTAAGTWAVVTTVAALLWFATVRGSQRLQDARAEAAVELPVARRPILWRTPLLWGLIGLMAMTALHTYTLVTWFPTMLQDSGLSSTKSALLLSWFAGLGLFAAFVVPPLATRLRNAFPVVVGCAALMAVGYIGMLTAPTGGALVWATAFGLGVSTFPLTLTLIGIRAADARSASQLSGTVQGVGYGIGCVGPLLLGALNQHTGTWDSTYLVLTATLLITLAAGWTACRPAAPALVG